MDNLCHTLVGAALAQSGLKRRSALATATLLIGANLPDVDVIAVPLGHSLEWRRGITHGIPALVVLPIVLTGVMLAWDRIVRRRPHRGRAPTVAPVRPGQLLLLAALAVLTHPVLDWMNSYGMRWLMPFDGRWSYGDALYIIDPWLWVMLAIGVAAARRVPAGRYERARSPSRDRAAAWALGVAAAYIAVMVGSRYAGVSVVRRQAERLGIAPDAVVAVMPEAVTPFTRQVVVAEGESYHLGTLRWLPAPRVTFRATLPMNARDPAAVAAAATPEARAMLGWSRFPFFIVRSTAGAVVVRVDDARYSSGDDPSWASVTVRLPPEAAQPQP
ncbi:MAG TPA: metal-dependent hydrolase [Gemmatimonadaceae bacterium]|nr:metal-dependent hydrolase [Gemmatimonadaceae bacterium]